MCSDQLTVRSELCAVCIVHCAVCSMLRTVCVPPVPSSLGAGVRFGQDKVPAEGGEETGGNRVKAVG